MLEVDLKSTIGLFWVAAIGDINSETASALQPNQDQSIPDELVGTDGSCVLLFV